MSQNSLMARMGLDGASFRSDFRKVEGVVSKGASRIKGLLAGAFGAGALMALGRQAMSTGSQISDMADDVGTTTEAFQVLNARARAAGVSTEKMTAAMLNAQKAAVDAAQGLKTQERAFETLGLDVEKFIAMRPEERMEELGRAYQASGRSAQAFGAIQDIVGKRNIRLLETMDALATEGYAELRKQAIESGKVMSERTIRELDKAEDAIQGFKQRITVAVGNIMVGFKTEEGIKKMTYKLMEAGTAFGGMLVDFFVDAGRMAWGMIGKPLGQIGRNFAGIISYGVNEAGVKLRELLVTLNQSKIAQRAGLTQNLSKEFYDDLAEAKSRSRKLLQDAINEPLDLSFGKILENALDDLGKSEPPRFTEKWSARWRNAAAEQQKALDELEESEQRIAEERMARQQEVNRIAAEGRAEEDRHAQKQSARGKEEEERARRVTVQRNLAGAITNWDALPQWQQEKLARSRNGYSFRDPNNPDLIDRNRDGPSQAERFAAAHDAFHSRFPGLGDTPKEVAAKPAGEVSTHDKGVAQSIEKFQNSLLKIFTET